MALTRSTWRRTKLNGGGRETGTGVDVQPLRHTKHNSTARIPDRRPVGADSVIGYTPSAKHRYTPSAKHRSISIEEIDREAIAGHRLSAKLDASRYPKRLTFSREEGEFMCSWQGYPCRWLMRMVAPTGIDLNEAHGSSEKHVCVACLFTCRKSLKKLLRTIRHGSKCPVLARVQ